MAPYSSTARRSPSHAEFTDAADEIQDRLDEAHTAVVADDELTDWLDWQLIGDRLVCQRPDGRRVVVESELVRTPTGNAPWSGLGALVVRETGPEELTITSTGSETEIVLTPERITVAEPGVLRRRYDWGATDR